MEAKGIILRAASVARDKKAKQIVALDMRKACGFCDYFLILSGTSLRQVNALAGSIEEELAKHRIKPLSRPEPTDESGWVVLDFASVVVHIFYKPVREFYALERLWSDAKRISLPRKI